MKRSFGFLVMAVLLALSVGCNRQRSSDLYVDSSLAAEIALIHAIDNHAHPEKVVGPGEQDHDYDALPMEGIEDVALPAPLQPGNPFFPAAWSALFQYRYTDDKPEHLRELEQTKRRLVTEKGDLYPAWVLNHANTDIMLANRTAMGRGLSPDRFKWVPFVDMFLLPLNNDSLEARDPDHRVFVNEEEKLLKNYLAAAQLSTLPASLDDYLTFVSHTLETWKANGAVALKFEFAYLRDLQIGNPQKENADRVYSIFAQSSEPSAEEYKILQDYIFRYIARQAANLELPVHIHCALGGGSYFRTANANPLALEPLFNDPALRKTKFVLLHGGWPFSREAAALILKPNVYLDFSAFTYMTYPVEAAHAIRLYLEAAPDKVLYGSDASPVSADVGWAETAWIGSHYGRLSLGIALTRMMADEEISAARAKEIAHMVLRENARQLYKF